MLRTDVTKRPDNRTDRWWAAGAVVGPLQFTLVWLLLGAVSTGYTLWDTEITSYSPISQPISGLGLGSTAAAMNTSFVLLGVLVIAGVIGVFRSIPELTSRQRSIFTVLLGALGVGAIMCGVFTLESFMLHFLGFALVLVPIVAFPVVGFGLHRMPGWAGLGWWLIVAGPLTLVLAVVYFATFDPIAAGEGLGVGGLTQRILVVEILMGYVILGWRAATYRPGPTVHGPLTPAQSEKERA